MTLGGVPVIRLSGPCTNEGTAPLVVYKYPSVLSPPFIPPSSLLYYFSSLFFTSTGEVAFLSVCLSGCKITGKSFERTLESLRGNDDHGTANG